MNPVIVIDRMSKTFRDFWRRPKVRAVDALSLEIRPGEIFGLLGPNGSGKSTTIKIILGLLHPSSGAIAVLGRPPRDVATKRNIGYLPEESYLYRYLTARETLSFYGSLFGIPSRVLRRRIDELLDMLDLTRAADRPVGEFSKGMARRIGLAQALLNDPRLVILDEPTAGLDPIGCRQAKDLMLALVQRGKTVLLSSHLLADVEDVCDRIAILSDGRVRAMGRVDELLEKRDRVRFTLPALPAETLRAAVSALREATGAEPELDHPSMNLEQFFLEVVSEAHGSNPRASPATDGRRAIADYLARGESGHGTTAAP